MTRVVGVLFLPPYSGNESLLRRTSTPTTIIASLYRQQLHMQGEFETVSMKDTTTYIGRKCSIKHDRKRDSASPARPVAGEMEKLGRWKLDFAADRLDFLEDPPLCLDAVRGRPNFRLVE